MSKKKTKKEKTELICILDRSGSMYGLTDDTIGGYNSFLDDQRKQNDDTSVTLVLFDHKYEVVYENVDVDKVKNLDTTVYTTRGMTRLNDAIGRALTSAKMRHDKMSKKNKPTNITVAILTDGHENDSKEYTTPQIKNIINTYEKEYDWKIIYLGANQDAFAVGHDYGLKDYQCVNFGANSRGINTAFKNVSTYSTLSKMCSVNDMKNFKKDEG